MAQEQETKPVLARRHDDPPETNFISLRRLSLEELWREKFNGLTEQVQQLRSQVSQLGVQLDAAQIELNDKLKLIIELSASVTSLRDKLESETRLFLIEKNELEDSIKKFTSELTTSQDLNKIIHHKDTKLTLITIAIFIITLIIFVHLVFY
jgi:DNA repair exonuclease SbcCD ATPase subunit